MDDANLAGRTPDRRDCRIGTFGVPRSGGEAGDRPNGGDFPWRVMNDCSTGVKPVR